MDIAAFSGITGNAASQVARSLAGPVSSVKTDATTTTTSTDSGNQITSNDFLTLLVTEMKNQDPTQPTDPNAYIQQLVGVNSLQQLIAINKDLTAVNTSSSASVLPATEAI